MAATFFDGYVTNIVFAGEFDVGQRHILCDAHTKWQRPHLPDYLTELRVGMMVRVEGDTRNGAFVAKSVQVDPRKTRVKTTVEGRGLIQQPPQLRKEGMGQEGKLWVEGYPLHVTPDTTLLAADGTGLVGEQVTANITTNVWATYKAERGSDGALTATLIKFEPNQVDADEQDYHDRAKPRYIDADPGKHKPAQLIFGSKVAVKFDVLPDQEVQDYVRRIGNSLVPQYQKDLPASDPTKIDFRFYVVKVASLWMGNMEDEIDLPNGIVLVQEDVLESFENEAQLAAFLAYCVAHVLEKQDYIYNTRLHRDKYAYLAGAYAGRYGLPVSEVFGLKLQALIVEIAERCDRIGLTYMLQQGYDIRQAALSQRKLDGTLIDDPLGPDETPQPRTVKLMEELQLDYAAINYADLKTNGGAFRAMKAKAHAAAK